MRKNNTGRSWLGVFLYAVLIFVFSAVPAQYVPQQVAHFDKLCHFFLYLPFGFLMQRAAQKSFPLRGIYSLLVVLFVILIYALSDEFHQTFVPGRTFSYFDMMADGAGAFSGCLLFKLWPR